MDLPKYHSIPEAARLTGLSESMIRTFVHSGQLRALRACDASNSRIKIQLMDLNELLERLSTPRD